MQFDGELPAVNDMAEVDLVVIAEVGDSGPSKIESRRRRQNDQPHASQPVMRNDQDANLIAFAGYKRLAGLHHPRVTCFQNIPHGRDDFSVPA